MTASQQPQASIPSSATNGNGGFAEQLLVRLQRERRRRRIVIATLGTAALALTVVVMLVLPASFAREIDASDLVAALLLSGLVGLGWIRS